MGVLPWGLLLLGLAAAPPTEQPLRVGTSTRNPPWVFVPGLDFSHDDLTQLPRLSPTQLTQLAGMDVDVMNALASRLGVRVQWVPTIWSDLESGLVAGHFDVLIGSWTPTNATPAAIAATSSYCEWGLLVGVRADEARISSYADLAGMRVGYVRDPAVARGLQAMGRQHYVPMSSEMRLLAGLQAGDLDGIIVDSIFLRWRAARDPGLRIVGEPLNRLGYHIGVRHDDAALLERLQAAVKALVDSGEAERIRRSWEGPEGQSGPGLR
jgi:ABC-type amino acid transport substrate-binding protein